MWGREEKQGVLLAVSEATFGRASGPRHRRLELRGMGTEWEVGQFGGASAISEALLFKNGRRYRF